MKKTFCDICGNEVKITRVELHGPNDSWFCELGTSLDGEMGINPDVCLECQIKAMQGALEREVDTPVSIQSSVTGCENHLGNLEGHP